MKIEDILIPLGLVMLFALGILGLNYNGDELITGAWGVPQTSVYAQLLPAEQWLYAGASASCIWEIHPNTTKTINSVSYGSVGSWTACSQSSTDWLLWTCGSVAAAEGIVACPQVRVVQNEFPGTSETLTTQNMTFKTASVKGAIFPGCSSPDCTITSSASIPAGTYFLRNLKIDAALTMEGNVSIITTENFTIGTTGGATIASSSNPYKFNVTAYKILNLGTLSASGTAELPGADIYLSAQSVNNTAGTITLNGGNGNNGGAYCGSYPPTGSWASNGGDGARGGTITITANTPTDIQLGTIIGNGGRGGNGAGCCSYDALASNGGKGGLAGRMILKTLNMTSTIIIYFNGGDGGAGGSSGCPAGYGVSCGNGGNAGAGNNHSISAYSNISISALMSSLAGTPGAAGNGAPWTTCSAGSTASNGIWNISYCANGTGMDWSKFSPAAITSALACRTPPVPSFVVPNTSSSFTSYLQNISVNAAQPTNISLLISYSKDSGATWSWFSPDFYSMPYNSSNNGTPYFDTHRQGTDNGTYSRMRVISYNQTSGVYSSPVTVSFNITDMNASVSGTAAPNGTVTTSAILFTCNFTNSTGYSLEAATAYLNLDGTLHAMAPNVTSKTYYWTNNASLLSGAHWWQCVLDKANYKSSNSSNVSFNMSGFGIFYPTGQTSVHLTCPFPTISGMTPAGQKAGIGIFRIQNNNATALKNYTLYLGNAPPPGATVYGRCDLFSANLAGWTALSLTTGYKGLINVNSTNSSAYCWLRMDCVDVAPGQYIPIDYIFTEE
jgi:hypothetical protein